MALRRAFLLALLGTSSVALAAEPTLPDLIDASRPSVLPVGTYSPLDTPRFTFHGTGFVVADGHYLVTNAHVLPPPDSVNADKRLAVQVPLARGRYEQRFVEVQALDRARDLALLKLEGAKVPALSLATPGQVREGQSIAVLGFPLAGALGFSLVTHRGIVSSISAITMQAPAANALSEQAVRRLREGSFDILQLDATAYPGNSGGPVMELSSGAVVGVLNMVLVRRDKESAISTPTGVSYAIPVQYVQGLLKQAGLLLP
ncbi:serine protease [Paucibacter sp. APW11]|uniref:Serine protease n=1 Tax=Roseateles aquae TaxID=3077235 RepID=A0ABU3P6Q2_9BURK|nr:serine protease [Paucibacter sp. APW11]MDT8997957.1 serine protease [Paucibacter sp. APW11]